MAGLDPAIMTVARAAACDATRRDGRVKPGHDDFY
jgi:hypothetical protein